MDEGYSKHLLIKLGTKEHMTALYEQGEIYMQTVDYFRSLEKKDDGRADPNENLKQHFQGNGSKGLTITVKKDGSTIHLSRESGLVFLDVIENLPIGINIYSLSHVGLPVGVTTTPVLDLKNFSEDKDYAVIIRNMKEFVERIRSSMMKQQGYVGIAARPVEYYDHTNYGGEVGIFRKSKEYEYQKEYRVVGYFEDKCVKKFYVGSLKGIAYPPMDKETFSNLTIRITNGKDGF